jgi:hypothetical protein
MRFPPIDINQLGIFRVPLANHAAYMELSLRENLHGDICCCGHAAANHIGLKCVLNETCACQNFKFAINTEDTRPFYQSTFGPFESHALGRGIALAEKLGIRVSSLENCMLGHCSNAGVGAMRFIAGRPSRIASSAEITEVHKLACYECADDLIFNNLRRVPFDLF